MTFDVGLRPWGVFESGDLVGNDFKRRYRAMIREWHHGLDAHDCRTFVYSFGALVFAEVNLANFLIKVVQRFACALR